MEDLLENHYLGFHVPTLSHCFFFLGGGFAGRCFFCEILAIKGCQRFVGSFFMGGCKMLRVNIFESRIHVSLSWGFLRICSTNQPSPIHQSTNSSPILVVISLGFSSWTSVRWVFWGSQGPKMPDLFFLEEIYTYLEPK